MKRILLFAPVLALVAAPAVAQIAPVPPSPPVPPPGHAVFVTSLMPPGAPIETMVARLLSFDRSGDGRVTIDELPERMEPLLARGDTNGDGALDAAEIRALVSTPLQRRAGGFGSFGGYGFADQFSFSSRNHIEGAVEDLKLAGPAADAARTVARAFADRVEAEARTRLLADLTEVLSTAQLAAFEQVLGEEPASGAVRVVTQTEAGAGPTRVTFTHTVSLGDPAIRLLDRFGLRPPERTLAQKAVERFRERLRLGDAERTALLDALRPWLADEEREDLRAALERRPMVPLSAGAIGGVESGIFR